MANNKRDARTTAPKGRPTPRRRAHGRGGVSSGLQWFLLALAGVVLAMVLFRLFTGDGPDDGALAAAVLIAPGWRPFGQQPD